MRCHSSGNDKAWSHASEYVFNEISHLCGWSLGHGRLRSAGNAERRIKIERLPEAKAKKTISLNPEYCVHGEPKAGFKGSFSAIYLQEPEGGLDIGKPKGKSGPCLAL